MVFWALILNSLCTLQFFVSTVRHAFTSESPDISGFHLLKHLNNMEISMFTIPWNSVYLRTMENRSYWRGRRIKGAHWIEKWLTEIDAQLIWECYDEFLINNRTDADEKLTLACGSKAQYFLFKWPEVSIIRLSYMSLEIKASEN